jgi:Flp pilus assembly protein CpaB
MKRIRLGTVTVAVMAILFGLLTAYVARHYFGAPTEGPPRRTATVVAPAVDLPKYGRIREKDLETIQMPIEDLPEGAVRTKSRALSRLVKQTVTAGQPILERDLYALGGVSLPADQSPPGRAAENVPTLAPPQSTASLAAGSQFRQGPRGQVIYVQVEAEGIGQAEN